MNKILYRLLFLLLLAVSCERTVDYPADEDGRIVVSAMLGQKEHDRINVAVSQPVSGTEDVSAEDVALHLEADGKPVELVRDLEAGESGLVSYIPQSAFSSGQELVLRAEAHGLPPVKSKTVVPAVVPPLRIETEKVESYRKDETGQSMSYLETLLKIHVALDEKLPEDSYFGVQVLRRKMYEFIGDVPEYNLKEYESKSGEVSYDNFYVNSEVPEGGAFSSIRSELVIDYGGGDMMVSALRPEDDNPAVDVYVDDMGRTLISASYTYVDGVEVANYEIYEYYDYDVKVYRLSSELYHYFKARYIVEESSAPIHLGFTPVTYTYTNVEGGLGIFGAVSMYETGWFTND